MSLCWLGWGRVNFLHGSLVRGWFGFVLEAVDNSGMFGSLLSRADTAKAFLGAHLTPGAQRLSTADPRDIPGLGHHAQSGNLGMFTLPQVPWDGQTLPIHGKWIPLLFLYVWLFFSLLDYLQPGHPSVSLSPSWMAPWMRLKAFPTADCNEKSLAKPWFPCLCHLITCHDHISTETSLLTTPKQKVEASKQRRVQEPWKDALKREFRPTRTLPVTTQSNCVTWKSIVTSGINLSCW